MKASPVSKKHYLLYYYWFLTVVATANRKVSFVNHISTSFKILFNNAKKKKHKKEIVEANDNY